MSSATPSRSNASGPPASRALAEDERGRNPHISNDRFRCENSRIGGAVQSRGGRSLPRSHRRQNIFIDRNRRSLNDVWRCGGGVTLRAQPLHLQPAGKGGSIMASGKSDELKGRVKEAAGALSGDAKLKREGKTDQAVGKVKQKLDKVIDKVKAAIS
jgi:uncharacterized protein YjbJ (UPF0337 family)